ncbi:MAG: beta-propeller domain-containing protein [Candidatus Diapherotrites archaeon]|nr:beta-propeller domain-containing protein [Candidatus Diapherotrites archaeon]
MERNFFAGVFALILFAAVLSGCTKTLPPQGNTSGGTTVEFKEIQRFKSNEELVAAFKEAQQKNYARGGIFDNAIGIGAVPMMATTNSGASAGAESGRGSTDFSTTNIQVEGVDEADIVKTDGRYIYNFSNNKLIITDAYPIEGSQIVSKTVLENVFPLEMFVKADTLLLFGNKTQQYQNENGIARPAGDIYYPYWSSRVLVQLYDVSDKSTPALEKELEFDGRYLSSRLIENNAFFVVNSYPFYGVLEKEGEIIPLMSEDGVEKKVAEPTEIGIIPPTPPSSFVTIVSMNLDSKEYMTETIAASAENVFASKNNLYLASTQYLPPKLPIAENVGRVLWGDEEKTVINKFGLTEEKIGFVGQGEVKGHVLNQFSMDEFEGKFRIATTSGQVFRFNSQSSNNLYVLDEEMKLIGRLEDLAPGEKIYSARFLGPRAYMVTFKKVDPLFVIDASDPANPKVLGKLKIPGYSDYLHPIDESHIIGVGKETIEAAKGEFAWYQGLKMAIFDVSNVENPKEMHKIVVGDRGTDSYALQDHKAFLYDKEKELLVLPIMLAEIPQEQKKPLGEEQISPTYGEPVFQGAFVYRLTLENGFEERARITHLSQEDELKRGYYYGDEYSVKRALFIEDVLYTLSDKMLKANSLNTLENLKEFVFG